jgi:hypothetical protein
VKSLPSEPEQFCCVRCGDLSGSKIPEGWLLPVCGRCQGHFKDLAEQSLGTHRVLSFILILGGLIGVIVAASMAHLISLVTATVSLGLAVSWRRQRQTEILAEHHQIAEPLLSSE